MKTRLLIIIGIITLPLVLPHGFSQCLYNNDWSDAPCFDMGPASHQKFHDAWAPYYEYKGTEWMESKKVEMNQALDNEIIEEWVEQIENYNVYRYYLSRNEIKSSLPYDSFFVRLDPNFETRESLSDEYVCGPDAELVEGICQMTIVYDAPHEVDGAFLGIFFVLFLVIIFGIVVLVVVWKKMKMKTRV